VLFDTRATHSFVTASWVESHNISVAPMYPPMRVSSIGGRTQTDRFCPSARVQIRGIEFPTYLIVMGVAEPPELFQLKCPSRTLKGSNTLKQE
jgi:hypothetical protein